MSDITIIDALKQFQGFEINEKYFYLILFLLADEQGSIQISIKELEEISSLGSGKIYRARAILIKKGILEIKNIYCIDTGKKLKTFYQLK